MGRVENKVALVTGAGQGIGRATSLLLSREGAAVAVTDIDAQAAETVAEQIRAGGGRARAWKLDVSVEAEVAAVVAEAGKEFGRLDILVNNAGITRTAMLHKMTPEQWQQVIDVHMNGSFYCLQAVVNGMIERKYGRIINVTSTAGLLGTIGQINYSAAKAAIAGMTKSAAKELGRHGITVNAIAPGAATPMTEVIRTDERFKDKYLERIPLGRWAEPNEVAPAFVFLASDWASYITGQILAVDGGLTIR